MKGITAMMAAAALTGFIHTVAAQEIVEATQPDNKTSVQNPDMQKPLLETFAPIATTPAPVVVLPTEKFLSELKVYPTF